MSGLFPGFEKRRIKTSGATINLELGGEGPPVLLLHGYPQTHALWHKVAAKRARDYTLVCPDLRGYGDSSKPKGLPDHSNYAKRAMALDMVEVMESLGASSSTSSAMTAAGASLIASPATTAGGCAR
jgi:haloacetate dehalogenase